MPDTSSEAYQKARHRMDDNHGRLNFDWFYAGEKGEYVETDVTTTKVIFLGTLTCRQMEKKGIAPVTTESSTLMHVAAMVGDIVASLYCVTCPYAGKDQLQPRSTMERLPALNAMR